MDNFQSCSAKVAISWVSTNIFLIFIVAAFCSNKINLNIIHHNTFISEQVNTCKATQVLTLQNFAT